MSLIAHTACNRLNFFSELALLAFSRTIALWLGGRFRRLKWIWGFKLSREFAGLPVVRWESASPVNPRVHIHSGNIFPEMSSAHLYYTLQSEIVASRLQVSQVKMGFPSFGSSSSSMFVYYYYFPIISSGLGKLSIFVIYLPKSNLLSLEQKKCFANFFWQKNSILSNINQNRKIGRQCWCCWGN